MSGDIASTSGVCGCGCGSRRVAHRPSLLVRCGAALAFACANGHADCTALLISKGAQANQRSSLGNAPLHAAAWADSLKCIRILVDAQADVDLKSFSGATPLHVAIQGGREAALAALLSFGASRTLKDGNGKTPMQLALSMGHTECVSVLKQSQAESEARERVRLCAEREVAEKRANAAAEAVVRRHRQAVFFEGCGDREERDQPVFAAVVDPSVRETLAGTEEVLGIVGLPAEGDVALLVVVAGVVADDVRLPVDLGKE
jgi:hypothetical protein